MLSERFGWEAKFESVADNPYLVDFYGDMGRWSFPLQVYFLNHRFRTHQEISSGTNSSIQDRSIYEDAHIFARSHFENNIMEERDYRNYRTLYDTMCQFLTPPDLIIYLRKSLPRLKEQIKLRGRSYEQEIPEKYLADLNRYYDDWMSHYSLGKKLIIDSDSMNFVKNPKDFEYIANAVVNALDQKDFFLTPREAHSQLSILT